jgi:hypothetical protein
MHHNLFNKLALLDLYEDGTILLGDSFVGFLDLECVGFEPEIVSPSCSQAEMTFLADNFYEMICYCCHRVCM